MNKRVLIGYLIIVLFLVLFSFLFIDANFFYLKLLYTGISTSNRELTSLIYVSIILIFFSLYLFLIKHLSLFGIEKDKFKFLIKILFICMLAYPAMLSYDIFNYIFTAKITFFYHENPYILMPIEIINDPILQFTRAANKISLYGPGWDLISGMPFLLSFGNYIVSILLIKVLIGLFFMGTLLFIFKITKSLFSVVLFAASPLVIVETFISGHNDIVMVCFALMSFYFLKNKKIFFSLLFLVISVSIKYSTLFLLPVYIFVLIKIYKKEKIDWQRIYFFSFISMTAIFLLSFFREEIYPWYAIWPLSFLVLMPKNKLLVYTFTALSLGLMISYVPHMYFGTYFGLSRILRVGFIFLPPVLFILYFFYRNKFNLKLYEK